MVFRPNSSSNPSPEKIDDIDGDRITASLSSILSKEGRPGCSREVTGAQ
jgi:hypothetical protein